MRKTIFLALFLGFALLHGASARAAGVCAAHPDDDTPRPLPAALVPAAEQAFQLHDLPAAQARQMTVMRCMGGKPWGCFVGANLPCGKANTAATLPAGKDWCQKNPDSDYIPAYISGHDSIYSWRCKAGQPVTDSPPAQVDARGFLSQYWKQLG